MEVSVFENQETASLYVAQRIANRVLMNNSINEKTVLGLATGSTPIPMYEKLIELHRMGVSFKNTITYNLDEYYPIKHSSDQSYHSFMKEHFFDHVDIQLDNTFIPNGEIEETEVSTFCKDYEWSIRKNGGIDIQILGLGLNGHIGFNEPGSDKDSVTRKVELSDITRSAATKHFGDKKLVPKSAITMGIETILEAQEIIVMAWGKGKSKIVKECIEGAISKEVPGSLLQKHNNVKVVLDPEAASELNNDRISLVEAKLSKT